MPMDGQQSAHGRSYAYASPYWAEFYDMWVEEIIGSTALAKDDDFFVNLLSPFFFSDDSSLRVVDMATGTGRVIRGILRGMKAFPPNEMALRAQNQLEIWGIDHSQAMIDQAKSLLDDEFQPPPTTVWRTSTAANFVDENPSLQNAVDLLIFAAGSIGHLIAKGERKEFLQQVEKALRTTNLPHTPRSIAAISILKHEDDPDDKCSDPDGSDENGHFSAEMRKASRRWPHLEYRKGKTTTRRDERRFIDSFNLKVIETATGTLVSQEDHSWSLEMFSQDEWEREVSECGLSIGQKVETKIELWYLLHRADGKNIR